MSQPTIAYRDIATATPARTRMEAAGRAYAEQRAKRAREVADALQAQLAAQETAYREEIARRAATAKATAKADASARADQRREHLTYRHVEAFRLTRSRGPTAREIIIQVARERGMKPTELTGPWRNKAIVAARHWAMYRCRAETPLSFPDIAECFGRDHTTVMHAYTKMVAQLAGEANL